MGKPFAWTQEARSLARRSDAIARAADIARGTPPPALLIVHGADDAMVDGSGARALREALAPHYAGKLCSERPADASHDGLRHITDSVIVGS